MSTSVVNESAFVVPCALVMSAAFAGNASSLPRRSLEAPSARIPVTTAPAASAPVAAQGHTGTDAGGGVVGTAAPEAGRRVGAGAAAASASARGTLNVSPPATSMSFVNDGRPALLATILRRPALTITGPSKGALPTETSSTVISTSSSGVTKSSLATRSRSLLSSFSTSARRSGASRPPPSLRYCSSVFSAAA